MVMARTRSVLRCHECQRSAPKVETFFTLSVSIPEKDFCLVPVTVIPREGSPVRYGVRAYKHGKLPVLVRALSEVHDVLVTELPRFEAAGTFVQKVVSSLSEASR